MLKSAVSRASLLSKLRTLPTGLAVECSHQQQVREASGRGFGGNNYLVSKEVGPPEMYTEVEKSYAEWKFVEKLLPSTYVPTPPQDPSIAYASGWKSPDPIRPDAQYHIVRSRNHMVPVYLEFFKKERGQRKWTRIRNIEGNIWALEKDIGKYLRQKYPHKTIITWLNESWRIVFIHGDYEEDVREWVIAQGF